MREHSILASVLMVAAACRHDRVLEVHRAEIEKQPGFVAVQDRHGTTYYMSPEVELTEADVRRVDFLPDENGLPRIKLLFSQTGASKFRALTQGHLNRPLVFMVGGKVAMIPFVNAVSTDDFTWIEGFVTADDAELLAKGIK